MESEEEERKNRRQALRMKKSRAINALIKLTDKLKLEQVLEPVETLFVIKEKATNRFKYCGDGELLDNFMKGKPLTSSLPARKNRYSSLVASKSTEKVVEPLTPQQYRYTCGVGSRKSLSEEQRDALNNANVISTGASVAFQVDR
ncbi:MAG: hypothetical protein ABW168_00655 [Sedimenticola sp.]